MVIGIDYLVLNGQPYPLITERRRRFHLGLIDGYRSWLLEYSPKPKGGARLMEGEEATALREIMERGEALDRDAEARERYEGFVETALYTVHTVNPLLREAFRGAEARLREINGSDALPEISRRLLEPLLLTQEDEEIERAIWSSLSFECYLLLDGDDEPETDTAEPDGEEDDEIERDRLPGLIQRG